MSLDKNSSIRVRILYEAVFVSFFANILENIWIHFSPKLRKLYPLILDLNLDLHLDSNLHHSA